ncbi:MAG: hypothetical protein U9Q84_01625 [Thermodesulfobacteriota bacterium]|nr:hypothetical protein [Thermodesulfobacteriota bacterium]
MSKKKGPDSITLTYDLLKWSIPTLEKFPKSQRFLLGDRIENHILDVLELLICANYFLVPTLLRGNAYGIENGKKPLQIY